MKGIGIKGVGLLPPSLQGGALGMPPWDFDPNLVTFTPGMAKRATSVFAAAPIVQGLKDGTGTPDVVSLLAGTAIVGTFCPNFDPNQGSFTLRWTPEYSSGGIATNYHYLFYAAPTYYFAYDYTNARYHAVIGNQTITTASAVTAGTAINLCFSWDVKNFIDGTNYYRLSINDAHTFGITTAPTLVAPATTCYIGSNGTAFSCSGIIEGAVIFRRVIFDGTYGVNVGNGDEVNLIAAGVDPTTITGSWDVCFCLPTNATAGALVTGTGEAWSHPHSSNLLTRGFLNDRYYGGSQWGVKFNGTSTKIDCGSGATLDDLCAGGAIMQVEGWVLHNGTTTQTIISKGGISTATGWSFYVDATGYPIILVDLANTNATATHTTTIEDGKWHHVLCHYNDTTKVAQVAVDGAWGAAGGVGDGAYVSDAALNLNIGVSTSGTAYYWTGSIGWINIHNDAHYTPGTNFLPPRALPAADVEEWALNEGTGVTATAQVTAPANNGTITAGTWEPQWYDEGTPVRLRSVVGSATYRAVITSAAEISKLQDAAFTVDGWVRITKSATLRYLCYKGLIGTNGWNFNVTTGGLLSGIVECATTDATSTGTARVDDGYWHYVKMTFDDAGDRKIDLFVDNVEVAYTVETAGNGAIVDDSAVDGAIGHATNGILGAHSWIRWSNVVRGAGMILRSNPPDPADANTIGQWNADEGYGAVLTDLSGEGNNAALVGTYSWNNSPAMESDSPGARNYAWGYVFGNDAADEGFKQTWVGLTAGKDYVIRALAYSEDGVGQPEMIVYDETNAAILKTMTGTVTSTEKVPDLLMCSFELPTNARGAAADCVSISVKIINTVATGVVGFQQVELLANLIDNPSMDTGAAADPWIPYGWTNGGEVAGDTEKETAVTHSGGASMQINPAGVAGHSIYYGLASTIGKFQAAGFWQIRALSDPGGHNVTMYVWDAAPQSKTAQPFDTLIDNNSITWKHHTNILRVVANNISPAIEPIWVLGQIHYVDDVYLIALNDVSLTVTPASAANSVESGGIRVDGLDNCNQAIPANRLFPNFGWSRFDWIPRHAIADMDNFGFTTPMIALWRGDANNYIWIELSAANTIRLGYVTGGGAPVTGDWVAAGAFVAGTNYQLEIMWTPGDTRLIVDGTTRITIATGPAFPVVPVIFYAGSNNTPTYHVDAVFMAP